MASLVCRASGTLRQYRALGRAAQVKRVQDLQREPATHGRVRVEQSLFFLFRSPMIGAAEPRAELHVMGTSHGEFVKYPRTPHLFGSAGTDDDKHLDETESERFLADPSLVVEEKIDGTNVGIHFAGGRLVLQCRGHLVTEGMHPQYDLFKQWTSVKRFVLAAMLAEQFILFGEWAYARHSVHYRQLPHYFFEFDIYDKQQQAFVSLEQRKSMLDGTGIHTVPVLHEGALARSRLSKLIGPSHFDSQFDNPLTGRTDNLMEGLYLRTEAGGIVTGRAKFVRPEFVQKLKQSTHWQQQALVPNLLIEGADIWS
jgi:RNA ligase